MERILVLCTGNSCRSQMAEGYLRKFVGERAEVVSAGVEAHGMNPRAMAVMLEDGIDLSVHSSKTIDGFIGQRFSHVITVCDNAKENCPWFPGEAVRIHQGFPDPAKAQGTEEEIMQEFRRVRDLIKQFSHDFARTLLHR